MEKKYTAFWEFPVYDEWGDEMYSETDSEQFDDFNEAVEWLGGKDRDINYYCVVFINSTGRIAHMGCLP